MSQFEQQNDWNQRTFHWSLVFWPIASLLLLGLLAYSSISNVRSAEKSQSDARNVNTAIANLLVELLKLETGLRGYLLTDLPQFLEPYHDGRASIESSLTELRGTLGLSKIAFDFEGFQASVDERRKILDQRLDLFVKGDKALALSDEWSIMSQEKMDVVRNKLRTLESRVSAKVREAADQSWNAYVQTAGSVGLALIFAMFAIGWSIIRVDSELKRRRHSDLVSRQRLIQMKLLADVVAKIVAARGTESIIEIALQEFRQLVGVREVLCRLERPEGLLTERSASALSDPDPTPDYLESMFQLATRVCQPISGGYANLVSESSAASTSGWNLQSENLLSVVLVTQSKERIGHILLIGKDLGDFNPSDALIATQLAHTITVALENSRLTEMTQRESERKDEFLAMLGHELRNPLASVVTGCEAMLTTIDPNELQQLLQSMQRQSLLMTHIVDDLLDVSRIGKNKIVLRREFLNFFALIEEVVEDQRRLHPDRQFVIHHPTVAGPAIVHGDRTRIVQSFTNLLNNACKFTPAESLIEVKLELDVRFVSVQVRDHGVGLTSKELRQVFELFHQTELTIHRSQGGLGIGLALAKGLIELHGGTIQAASAGIGKGATFSIRLPIATPNAPSELANELTSTSEIPTPRLRILAIDDRIDAILPLRVLLTNEGHQFVSASDGQAGLTEARRFQPELIFCDIGLPGGMNGYDVAVAIRKDPDLARCYMVALSGYSQPNDIERSKTAGFNEHIAKPLSAHQLYAIVASVKRVLQSRQETH